MCFLLCCQYSGVLGLFNCQGGGWCPVTRRNRSASDYSHSVTCFASPQDIEWGKGKHPICIEGVDVFAVYLFKDDKLKLLRYTESVQVSLEPFSFELLTVSPVVILPRKSIQLAPIGLVNMLNSGGSILSIEFDEKENLARFGVRGHGEMRVFASEKPECCKIDGKSVEFNYVDSTVRLQVSWQGSSRLSVVEYLFWTIKWLSALRKSTIKWTIVVVHNFVTLADGILEGNSLSSRGFNALVLGGPLICGHLFLLFNVRRGVLTQFLLHCEVNLQFHNLFLFYFNNLLLTLFPLNSFKFLKCNLNFCFLIFFPFSDKYIRISDEINVCHDVGFVLWGNFYRRFQNEIFFLFQLWLSQINIT